MRFFSFLGQQIWRGRGQRGKATWMCQRTESAVNPYYLRHLRKIPYRSLQGPEADGMSTVGI